MECLTGVAFSWQGRKVRTYCTHRGQNRRGKLINRVLEKHVRLVALSYASPKVNVTANILVPRKERLGPTGMKRFPKQLVVLSYYIKYYC